MTFGAVRNKLVTLDSELCKHIPKLEWIVFAGNLPEHVGEYLLTNLKQLKHSNFVDKPCTNILTNSLEEVKEINEQLLIQYPPIL